MYMYMYVDRQFACKHYTITLYAYINLGSKKRTVTVCCFASTHHTFPARRNRLVTDSFMVNLVFLRARSCDSVYGPAIQRCLLVIHTIATHSRTAVHVTYYTANADGRPAEKAATRTAVQYTIFYARVLFMQVMLMSLRILCVR